MHALGVMATSMPYQNLVFHLQTLTFFLKKQNQPDKYKGKQVIEPETSNFLIANMQMGANCFSLSLTQDVQFGEWDLFHYNTCVST